MMHMYITSNFTSFMCMFTDVLRELGLYLKGRMMPWVLPQDWLSKQHQIIPVLAIKYFLGVKKQN